jgi:hypothetical protein
MCRYLHVFYERCGWAHVKEEIIDRCKDFKPNPVTGIYECVGVRDLRYRSEEGMCPHCQLEVMLAEQRVQEEAEKAKAAEEGEAGAEDKEREKTGATGSSWTECRRSAGAR